MEEEVIYNEYNDPNFNYDESLSNKIYEETRRWLFH